MITAPQKGGGGDEGCPAAALIQRLGLSTEALAPSGVTGRGGGFVHAAKSFRFLITGYASAFNRLAATPNAKPSNRADSCQIECKPIGGVL